MAYTDRNSNSRGSAFAAVWAVAASLLAGLLWWLCLAGARAGDEGAGPPLSLARETNNGKDLAATIRVRKALESDTELRPLKINLHVKMTKGIAQLSGAVPSAAARKRVVRVVEQVPGVLRVEGGGLYLAQPRTSAPSLTQPIAPDPPTRTLSASPHSSSAARGRLTGREPPGMGTQSRSPVHGEITQSRSPRSQRVTLLAPEGIAPRANAPAPAESITAAIDRLRREDARFRQVRTELHGSSVHILSGKASGEQVMAFAQVIARLPGVERVIITPQR